MNKLELLSKYHTNNFIAHINTLNIRSVLKLPIILLPNFLVANCALVISHPNDSINDNPFYTRENFQRVSNGLSFLNPRPTINWRPFHPTVEIKPESYYPSTQFYRSNDRPLLIPSLPMKNHSSFEILPIENTPFLSYSNNSPSISHHTFRNGVIPLASNPIQTGTTFSSLHVNPSNYIPSIPVNFSSVNTSDPVVEFPIDIDPPSQMGNRAQCAPLTQLSINVSKDNPPALVAAPENTVSTTNKQTQHELKFLFSRFLQLESDIVNYMKKRVKLLKVIYLHQNCSFQEILPDPAYIFIIMRIHANCEYIFNKNYHFTNIFKKNEIDGLKNRLKCLKDELDGFIKRENLDVWQIMHIFDLKSFRGEEIYLIQSDNVNNVDGIDYPRVFGCNCDKCRKKPKFL